MCLLNRLLSVSHHEASEKRTLAPNSDGLNLLFTASMVRSKVCTAVCFTDLVQTATICTSSGQYPDYTALRDLPLRPDFLPGPLSFSHTERRSKHENLVFISME